jgi:murein DD-endopeptidase MepM/ murein hydrolase activator NlpD
MKRLAAAVALALALAGSASADTFRVVAAPAPDVFRVVPDTAPGVSAFLPSPDAPNGPGSISFPDSLRSYPPVPETRTYAQLLDLWQQAGAAYGVPWQVLASINKVESNFGRNMGPSSAGAIGWMQFMPSTWERWGVDANGDGIANPWSPEDAIAAAARYLAASGGQIDISRAIFSYNHAQWYVDEVQQLAQLFSAGGVDATFNLDKLQISLDKARTTVVQTNRKLVKALRQVRAIARHEQAIQRRAADTRLLSDRFALDRRAGRAAVVRGAAEARVQALRAALAQAETDLASARDRSVSSSFSPAAGSLLGAPSFDSGYVFPVGGGPSLVSVSHHHHDYPAADIAAPEGSPVYALSDAVVERAWQFPDARCGIGMTVTTLDGQSWTYCHLSYVDPAITAGVQLAAGTQIGLVGMTGHATGPHLHLQLNPATSYPQLQPWFQRFANVAFRWQDAGPTDSVPASAGPVFAVVKPETTQTGAAVVLFTR